MTETVLAPFGVQVDGLDAIELDETGVARLRTLLAEHGVLVLPGQGLDDDEFSTFLQAFGDLMPSIGETPVDGHEELNVISNVGRNRPARSTFHVDTSYLQQPPAYTALRAVIVPAAGGETLFSNQYLAFDTLPAAERERLTGRTMEHVVTGVDLGPHDESSAWHPLFRPHPLTGRIALFLTTASRCARIRGLGEAEKSETVDRLLAHSTAPGNVYRHRWSMDDLVIWDNACVLHKADHQGVIGDRVMHRGMVAGYGPAAADQSATSAPASAEA